MRHLRELVPLGVFFFSLFFSIGSPVWSSFPEERLTARAAILMDAVTGQLLYEREPDLRLPPASTTKVITAIVALESPRKGKDLLRVTQGATQVPFSKLKLRPGQVMSIEHLLYSVLLSSANDASVVLAEGIAGSVARFVEMMTRKARDIGATNSHFTNPHGLTAPDHYSTARDMALIFSYAMRNPIFREIVQTKTASVESIGDFKKRRRVRYIPVRNHNRLLWNFEGALGGKSGYTYAAQKCFVGAASRNSATLIVSIMGSRDLWGDAKRLLEYGFENYETVRALSPLSPRSLSKGETVIHQERPSSPLFSWEEELRLRHHNGYVLQVASFREADRAESLLKSIRDAGYQVFLEKALLGHGEITYRVKVGPYPNLPGAQQVAQEIEKKSGFRAIILPFSSESELKEKPT